MAVVDHKEIEFQIIEIEKKLLEAVKKSDHYVLDELLHDQLLFSVPNGQIITKAMDLDAHRSGQMVVNSIEAQEQVINVIDDLTAVVAVIITTDGRMMGQPIAGAFRYIRVWKLLNDQWKIIGGGCTQIQ